MVVETISRKMPIDVLMAKYNTLTGPEKAVFKILRNDSLPTKRNKMLNAMVKSKKFKLTAGERMSFNYGDTFQEGQKMGRPRTNKSQRQRVCKPVGGKEQTKKVEEQSIVCREKGRKEGLVGSVVKGVRIIDNSTKVETLRRLARKHNIRNAFRKNKQTLIDELRQKNILNYKPDDLE